MTFPPSCPIFCQSAEFTPLPHSPSLSVLSSKGPLSVVKCNWSQGEFLVPMQEPLQITCSVTGGPHQSLSREARERKEVLFTASTLTALRKSSAMRQVRGPRARERASCKYKASFLRELSLVLSSAQFSQVNSGYPYLSGPR